jgi:hypothetical protein
MKTYDATELRTLAATIRSARLSALRALKAGDTCTLEHVPGAMSVPAQVLKVGAALLVCVVAAEAAAHAGETVRLDLRTGEQAGGTTWRLLVDAAAMDADRSMALVADSRMCHERLPHPKGEERKVLAAELGVDEAALPGKGSSGRAKKAAKKAATAPALPLPEAAPVQPEATVVEPAPAAAVVEPEAAPVQVQQAEEPAAQVAEMLPGNTPKVKLENALRMVVNLRAAATDATNGAPAALPRSTPFAGMLLGALGALHSALTEVLVEFPTAAAQPAAKAARAPKAAAAPRAARALQAGTSSDLTDRQVAVGRDLGVKLARTAALGASTTLDAVLALAVVVGWRTSDAKRRAMAEHTVAAYNGTPHGAQQPAQGAPTAARAPKATAAASAPQAAAQGPRRPTTGDRALSSALPGEVLIVGAMRNNVARCTNAAGKVFPRVPVSTLTPFLPAPANESAQA